MPHATVKLLPGVDQNRTPTLNEAAISESQLIRFVPDKQGLGLVQKLGGWTRYFSSSIASVIRALWAWQDTNATQRLAVGCDVRTGVVTGISNNIISAINYVTITFSGTDAFSIGETIGVTGVNPSGYNGSYTITSVGTGSVTFAGTNSGAWVSGGLISSGDGLSVISGASRQILTPTTQEANVSVSVSAVAGVSTVTITASNSKIYDTDSIFIRTPISIGGLILFGVYQGIFVDGTNQFQIVAKDVLGNPKAATTTATGGAVPSFATTNGSSVVSVTLNSHGYLAGDTFTALVPTTVGGVTIFGNYSVVSVTSANVFVIYARNTASSTTTGSMNGGLANYIYYRTPGVLPTSTGYGVGGYGAGGYGTGVAPTASNAGAPYVSTDWTLDNWGQILISCPVSGPVFYWDPTSGIPQTTIITNAPPANDGMFVAMPQRQIVTWGSTFSGIQDPLLIRWCDVDDYNQWIALPANQAGSYRMPKGSKIVSALQGPQQGIVWTDLAVWAMQYVGPPYVYQFNELGNGCGLIGRKAMASMDGAIYWMSQSQFYVLGAEGVRPITCPIWDVIFQDIDMSGVDHIRCAPNSRFNEISWFYPTTSSGGQVNKYVKYNIALGTWDFGELSRTAWINQSVLGPPVGAGTISGANFIYQHETSQNADNLPMISSFRTGFFSVSEGEWKIFIDQIWPDMKWGYYGGAQDADLTITFYVSDYPHTNALVYGPYPFNNQTDFITPRFRGRLVSIEISSSDFDSFWRIGGTRYRFQQDGKF